jgi:hypothetical protein
VQGRKDKEERQYFPQAFEGLGKEEEYVGEHRKLGEEEDRERTR